MGVYNPLAKIPHGCGDCNFYEGCYCPYLDEAYVGEFQKKNEKHPDCPLIEVKTPHGRCIDADEFLKDMNCGIWNWSSLDSVSAIMALTQIMSDSHYVPTVIEAEGAS